MVIVYRSNTGFTREYAEMLGRAEKIKVYSVTEAEGVDQAVKRYQVRGVCGVGLSPSGRQVLETISRANYVPNAPIFYLQGGWAPKKVSWLKRRMVGMATKSLRESLQDKGSRRTPEEQAQLDLLVKGGSRVAFERLEAIRDWMKDC